MRVPRRAERGVTKGKGRSSKRAADGDDGQRSRHNDPESPDGLHAWLMDKLNKARRVDDHKAFNVEARGGCWAYSLMACVLSVAHATPQPGISTRLCNTVPIGKVMAADRLREALLRKAIYELFMAAAAAIGNHVVDDVVADFIKHNMENELTELIYEDTPNLWQTCSSSSHGGWGGSCVLLLAMVALRLSHVFVIDTSILMERTPVTHLSVEWDGNSPVSMQQRPIYMSRDHAEAASVKLQAAMGSLDV